MSKTYTVAPFCLIFARKVHFFHNISVRENFGQNWPKSLLVEDHDATTSVRRTWQGGALASAKFAHGVHAHGMQLCSELQCLSQSCLRAPASALEAKFR